MDFIDNKLVFIRSDSYNDEIQKWIIAISMTISYIAVGFILSGKNANKFEYVALYSILFIISYSIIFVAVNITLEILAIPLNTWILAVVAVVLILALIYLIDNWILQ